MVLIMVTSMIPFEKGAEVRRKYDKIQQKFPFPPYIKKKQIGARTVREGMKAIAVYEVEKGKIAEALNFVYRYETEFAGIEGYSDDIETLLEMEELTGVASPLN